MSNALQQFEDLSADQIADLIADLKMSVDFEEYARTKLKVQPREGGGVKPFILNGPQRLYMEIERRIIAKGRLVRVVLLKGRRQGVSTLFSGDTYQFISSTPSVYGFQITHEPQATEFIFKMVKRFHNNIPAKERPEVLANNARLLEFNNAQGTGLDSAFRVATGGKDDVGSGQAIHRLHLSDAFKLPRENAEGLIKAVLPCVPPEPDTKVIIEGTANGVGGEVYNRFWGCRYRYFVTRLNDDGSPALEESINEEADPENDYTAIFFPWFIFELNRKTPPADFVLTDEEKKIKETFNLQDDQMCWRRSTLANEAKGSKALFEEMHPSTPESAFLSTGQPVFDNEQLMLLKRAAPAPKARYTCMVSTGQWLADPNGGLRVWEEPKVGYAYILSADVAEGLEQGDFDSADVINHRTGEQVAHWHGKVEPKVFGQILIALGKRYNVAYIIPERNNHGLTTVTEIVDSGYPRLHCETVIEPPNKPRKRWGWVTSSKTRTVILDNLKMEMIEGTHGIRCAETFNEMQNFKKINGREEAEQGQFDDRVLSISIAKHARLIVPIPQRPKSSHIKEPGKKGGGSSSWGGN